MKTCPYCNFSSRNPLSVIDHIDTFHYRQEPHSIERDRSLAGVAGRPMFVRGEWVVRASDWSAVTGVRPQQLAHEVVDIERDPGLPGAWKVGTTGTGILYGKESEFVLLEEIDNYEPDGKVWKPKANPEV